MVDLCCAGARAQQITGEEAFVDGRALLRLGQEVTSPTTTIVVLQPAGSTGATHIGRDEGAFIGIVTSGPIPVPVPPVATAATQSVAPVPDIVGEEREEDGIGEPLA